MIAFCMLDRGQQLSDEKVILLKTELARMNPTLEQLQRMYDRFMRNNNFQDFSLFRFIDGTIPLYTQQQLDDYVGREIRSLLEQARTAVHTQYAKHHRLSEAKEYLFNRELHQELEIRFYAAMDVRKHQERQRFADRIGRAKLWLHHVHRSLVIQAFKDSLHYFNVGGIWRVEPRGTKWAICKGDWSVPVSKWDTEEAARIEAERLRSLDIAAFPPDSMVRQAQQSGAFVEPLFVAIEQLMRRLPCHFEECTAGDVPTAAQI